jgi:hypothetical protein
MSVICTLCNISYCGCEGAICANCRGALEAIQNDPTLTPEQKQEKIIALNVNNNQT